MRRDPIECPKCGAVFDPEAILKSRRGKPVEETPAKPEPAPEAKEDILDSDDGEDVLGDDDDDVLEDASDLEDDDMSAVIEADKDDDES